MSNPTPTPPGSTPGPDRGAQPGGAPAADQPGTSGKAAKPGKGGAPATKGSDKQSDPLRRSRAGGLYVGVIALGIVLILLIIFVAQNTDPTTVRFLGWQAEIPVAVALLIAAVAGLFLAGIAASLRIFQLRRRVKHDRKA
ncbi:putative membrane protein [Nocardioides aquaticus]|uniref:Membrane protein n=1 Tax=Nocardioides aquaticus TaxID=160826 RepID=A0ABX8EJL9_9ACTN|nr:lipopolysaccharide assembly protein LapA domain-containing protein [Nocardioides aquaticus]QVT80714.1 putative membrane protein [Nocardioides aquaticus]